MFSRFWIGDEFELDRVRISWGIYKSTADNRKSVTIPLVHMTVVWSVFEYVSASVFAYTAKEMDRTCRIPPLSSPNIRHVNWAICHRDMPRRHFADGG
jgi:hypothetical protein